MADNDLRLSSKPDGGEESTIQATSSVSSSTERTNPTPDGPDESNLLTGRKLAVVFCAMLLALLRACCFDERAIPI